MAERKIKKSILESYLPFSQIKDEADDALLIPALQTHFIDPLLKLIPEDKELTQADAMKYLSTVISNFTDPIKTEGSPAPIILLAAGALAFPILQGALGAITSTVLEKHVKQNLASGIRPTLISPAEAIHAEYLDPKFAELRDSTLRKLGYSDTNIEALKLLNVVIPGATDIISFAVREVYSPEIAEKFGQFEGLDEVYKVAEKDIRAIGMSKETFSKFWAAHWILPSVMQGFEMLHRGVIDDDTLDMLFKALDIMPGWRDQLKAISYNPYTRVDVRRMHKVGVLDRSDVKRSYLDLGFNEEKAENMTEFTVRYNEDILDTEQSRARAKAEQERDLTKSDILRLYRKEIIMAIEAEDWLSQLGYDSVEIALLLSRENYAKEEERTDTFIKLYHDAYTKGIWTKTDLIIKLGELNLPSKYENFLMETWDLEISVKVQRPSKSELLGFFKSDLIDSKTLRIELKNQGYIDKYIDWYIKATGKKEISV